MPRIINLPDVIAKVWNFEETFVILAFLTLRCTGYQKPGELEKERAKSLGQWQNCQCFAFFEVSKLSIYVTEKPQNWMFLDNFDEFSSISASVSH